MSCTAIGRGCGACPASSAIEWRDLPDCGLAIIEKYKRERILKPGEVIHNQGDPCEGIYCLKEGLVGERRVDCDGRSVLVRVHHSGASFGYREALSGTVFANSAEALRESRLCFIGRTTIRELIERHPALAGEFLQRSMRDCQKLEDSLVEAKTLGVKYRLLQLLVEFYKKLGADTGHAPHAFDIPVARQDLAGLIGTAPETISRTIRQLEKEGLMHFEGQRARFLDFDLVSRELHRPLS